MISKSVLTPFGSGEIWMVSMWSTTRFTTSNIMISRNKFQRHMRYPSDLLMPYAIWVGTSKRISIISLPDNICQKKRSIVIRILANLVFACRGICVYYLPYFSSRDKCVRDRGILNNLNLLSITELYVASGLQWITIRNFGESLGPTWIDMTAVSTILFQDRSCMRRVIYDSLRDRWSMLAAHRLSLYTEISTDYLINKCNLNFISLRLTISIGCHDRTMS